MIRKTQSSFVPGRHTTDNIIVVQEVIHTMCISKRKEGMLAVKIDLEKGYDRIKWAFLYQVLQEIGFPGSWVHLIMFIVTSNNFAILWNKEQLPFFAPSRGLRQGDPLSHYLFVLCLEKLSHLKNEEVRQGNWKPIEVTRSGPSISHVCFADDIMLFGEASEAQLNTMMRVLDTFCLASGSKVSLQK